MKIYANFMLTGQHWKQNAILTFENGIITAIEENAEAGKADYAVDILVPSVANLHSHSFQRAMAGMTEYRTKGRESFWTWRDVMYRFLDHITPDMLEAFAALTFMEMLEAGYASVGEFHYIHHQQNGVHYDALSELSQRIFQASLQTGIGLTHLPVLYTYAGVNQESLGQDQMRFFNSVDQFLELHAACKAHLAHMPHDAKVGIAPHSLRATSPDDLHALLKAIPEGPVHIHIAEQIKEVDAIQSKLGQRPVEWLLNHYNVNERWCLVHATHLTDVETIALAKSKAIAGLCPITEANLGDGIFKGSLYLREGGAFGIGSDSNVRISLSEELRLLEYSQRLRDQARNVLVDGEGSVGHTLYTQSAEGGARALGRQAGSIGIGKWADLVAIDHSHPSLCALNIDQVLDGLVFSAPDGVITDTWAAGRHMVKSGHHIHRDQIIASYKQAITQLLSKI